MKHPEDFLRSEPDDDVLIIDDQYSGDPVDPRVLDATAKWFALVKQRLQKSGHISIVEIPWSDRDLLALALRSKPDGRAK